MSDGPAKFPRWAWLAIGLGLVVVAWAALPWIDDLRATQGAVASYVELIAAANAGDIPRVRGRCSTHYLAFNPVRPAKEGGVIGLPRGIHKNFQAWRHGEDVWLCPTNRVGPVYRFVHEGEAWKFDGPVGVLRAGGRVVAGESPP